MIFHFQYPPQSAKPRVGRHWRGSNVTKESISKDIEWMKRVGIGGSQAFDVSLGGGQNVDMKTIFIKSEWLETIRHSAAKVDRLGLVMTEDFWF